MEILRGHIKEKKLECMSGKRERQGRGERTDCHPYWLTNSCRNIYMGFISSVLSIATSPLQFDIKRLKADGIGGFRQRWSKNWASEVILTPFWLRRKLCQNIFTFAMSAVSRISLFYSSFSHFHGCLVHARRRSPTLRCHSHVWMNGGLIF